MSLLELGGQTFTIPVGEVALGSDASCAISVAGPGVLPRHALLAGQPDGQVVIRKASPAADVLINGVRLGAEPTPLLHGDKIEVGGQELTFVDERRSGSTQSVQALNLPPNMAQAMGGAGGPGRAKSAAIGTTGGRVVSLTDGREYVITGPSLVFGREAGCDVVVAGKDVSRRHAEIVQTPKGYLLVDSSTNGTFVNEEQVQGQRLLARADVIRLGEEQFRFYADVAAPAPPSARPGTPAVPPAAGDRLRHTVHGLEAATPSRVSQGGALANFLVRSGALKGQRLEGIWVLVDLESTNGSFVDGERIKGDAPLAPGALVRLGDVQLVFEPTDDALGVAKGGGTQVLKTPHSLAPAPAPAAPPAARPPAPPRTAVPGKPLPTAPPPKPGAKPAPKAGPKRPVAQQPPAKKGKGCGASAAAFVLGCAGLAALVHRLLG